MTDDDGKVVPLRRTQPEPDWRVSRSVRRAPKPARDLAVAQNAADREAYAEAAFRQREQWLLEHGTPVPARITVALGDRGGPEVDLACGTWEDNPAAPWENNPDGDVDAWEDVDDPRLPNGEQVRKMSAYTGFGIAWFYEPWKPIPMGVWVCTVNGCEYVFDDGVPVPPAKEPGQHALPGMPAETPAKPRRKRPTAPAEPKPKKPPPAVVQPPLPNRMPAHLRAELEEKLAQRPRRPTGD